MCLAVACIGSVRRGIRRSKRLGHLLQVAVAVTDDDTKAVRILRLQRAETEIIPRDLDDRRAQLDHVDRLLRILLQKKTRVGEAASPDQQHPPRTRMQAKGPLELAHVLERELILEQRIQVLRRLHRTINEQQPHALLVVEALADLDGLPERVARLIYCFLFLDKLFHLQLFVLSQILPFGLRLAGTFPPEAGHHACCPFFSAASAS